MKKRMDSNHRQTIITHLGPTWPSELLTLHVDRGSKIEGVNLFC